MPSFKNDLATVGTLLVMLLSAGFLGYRMGARDNAWPLDTESQQVVDAVFLCGKVAGVSDIMAKTGLKLTEPDNIASATKMTTFCKKVAKLSGHPEYAVKIGGDEL